MMTARVFLSYKRDDAARIGFLKERLEVLSTHEKIDFWYDSKIRTSSDFDAEIQNRLRSSERIIVVLSTGYLTSEYIARHEWPVIRERCSTESGLLFPVLLEPCNFKVLDGSEFMLSTKQIWPQYRGRLVPWVDVPADERRPLLDQFDRDLLDVGDGPGPGKDPALPAFEGAWWREVARRPIAEVAAVLRAQQHPPRVSLWQLTDALPIQLAALPRQTAWQALQDTNDLLDTAYGDASGPLLLRHATFEGSSEAAAWGAALAEAGERGSVTLIALFVMLFRHAPSLADANLIRLHRKPTTAG